MDEAHKQPVPLCCSAQTALAYIWITKLEGMLLCNTSFKSQQRLPRANICKASKGKALRLRAPTAEHSKLHMQGSQGQSSKGVRL
eukprot:1155615-Pelagomonas_calceolata.AAC.1